MKNNTAGGSKALTVAENILKGIPAKRKNLIFFLHQVQNQLGYFPEEVVLKTARHFSVSPAEIFSILTFYSAFKLDQSCAHHIKVCQGTACHVRGSEAIMKEFSRLLGIEPGGYDRRKGIALEAVNCLGCCAIGPVVVVDGHYHARVHLKEVEEIVAGLMTGEKSNGTCKI
ncbi:MAG TPA: NAD(P)H-dependent oxidoreductase subunit E [Candidatus Saccharicenans sp.]|jgi:NADH-quinone oxidoreductase subunit E|nr:NAD(P)H-dependent oxidoreductase subunit E [Candidatus Saccharicenans sp.]HRD02619.1 NAD(P)H-dependent oxidoreductase subunit E [Candidatus Saccharicenans sp.]